MNRGVLVLLPILTLFGTMQASATCNWTAIANGTTADAAQVMNNFDCLAPKASPSFTGTAFFAGGVGISGAVGIGTSSPGYQLTIAASSRPRVSLKATTGTADDWIIETNLFGNQELIIENATSGAGGILTLLRGGNVGINQTAPTYTLHVNGSVAGTSAYYNLSDARMKKNVREITDSVAILTRLKGVRFDWKMPRERSVGKDITVPIEATQVGFIAQDVMAALPEAVSKSKDGVYSVAETKIVPILVEAVKAQQKQIGELLAENRRQARINAKLSGRVAQLERKADARFALK